MSTVALPIETKVRELDGKLWLGLHLLAREHSAVLGPAGEVRASLHRTAPDVYISKDPGDGNVDFFDALRAAGCRVCGLDPEGGVFTDTRSYLANKQQVFAHVDRYCMWGRTQAEAAEDLATDTTTVTVTGNPRFNLCRPAYRSVYDTAAAHHRDRHGAYVLFNMNFALANPHDLAQQQRLLRRNNRPVDPVEYGYQSVLWHEMLAAAHHLAMHTDLQIVVRPHPSEDHAVYEHLFAAQPTIVSTHEGRVRPWIVGATAVVHNGCTTGIESTLLGTPTIAYQPVADERFDSTLPNTVSRSVRSRDALTEAVLAAGEDTTHGLSAAQRDVLDAYFTTEGPPAAEAICDVIEGLGPRGAVDAQRLHPGSRRVAEEAAKALLPPAGVAVLDAVRARLGDDRGVRIRADRRQRFPGLTAAELRARIADFTPHLRIDAAAVTVRPVRFAPNTYVLSLE